MIIRILATFYISLVIIISTESAPTAVVKARQFLYAKPGFVPVYIRDGDTPLEDINPDLAEAFNIYAQKHGRITYGRQVVEKLENSKGKKLDNADVELEDSSIEDNTVNDAKSQIAYQHIQKIIRE